MFSVIRKTMSDVKMVAHLCPPRLIGRSSCWVKRFMNQPWRVSRRLFSHRLVAAG